MITLRDSVSGSSATISPIGASLVALNLAGNQLVKQLSPENPSLFSGNVLAPWSSRLAGGQYTDHHGQVHKLPINEPERNNALHGLVYNREFSVARSTESSVELTFEIEPTTGYPFSLKLAIGYELEDGQLFVSFAVKNNSRDLAPFAIAFHPYFVTGWLGESAVVQVDAASFFEVDENLVPIGVSATAGSSSDLSVGRVIKEASLDTGFTDLVFHEGESCAKVINSFGTGLELWQEGIFKHTVVFTTDNYQTEDGTESAVAIEPSTSEANAFNSKQDVLWLEPGQTRSGSWGVRLV
jgi:aldose 1-epimerase